MKIALWFLIVIYSVLFALACVAHSWAAFVLGAWVVAFIWFLMQEVKDDEPKS